MLNKGNLKTCIEIFFQTMYLDFLKRSTKVCAIKKTITSLNFGQFLHLSIAYILFSLIFFSFIIVTFLFSPLSCFCLFHLWYSSVCVGISWKEKYAGDSRRELQLSLLLLLKLHISELAVLENYLLMSTFQQWCWVANFMHSFQNLRRKHSEIYTIFFKIHLDSHSKCNFWNSGIHTCA